MQKYKEALQNDLLKNFPSKYVCTIRVDPKTSNETNAGIFTDPPIADTENGADLTTKNAKSVTTPKPTDEDECFETEIVFSHDSVVPCLDWGFILVHGGFMLVILVFVDWAFLTWFSSLSFYEAFR